MNKEFKRTIGHALNLNAFSLSPITGGDTAKSLLIRTDSKKYFAKIMIGNRGKAILKSENESLQFLELNGISVPKVITVISQGDINVLVLEYLSPSKCNDQQWRKLAIQLARLHQITESQFGLHFNNFIGCLAQINGYTNSFHDFYINNRLIPQVQRARNKGLFNQKDVTDIELLYFKISSMVNDELPTLIHGDLWNGNVIFSDHHVYFIDPSISFANRELDLAMMKLFGGFPNAFFKYYNEILPIKDGFEQRMPLYQLYYLLVHLNMFGILYKPKVMDCIRYYI